MIPSVNFGEQNAFEKYLNNLDINDLNFYCAEVSGRRMAKFAKYFIKHKKRNEKSLNRYYIY